eukprot:1025999-Pyramimonas_sp.AAC.1
MRECWGRGKTTSTLSEWGQRELDERGGQENAKRIMSESCHNKDKKMPSDQALGCCGDDIHNHASLGATEPTSGAAAS